jgi:hypothetical protein
MRSARLFSALFAVACVLATGPDCRAELTLFSQDPATSSFGSTEAYKDEGGSINFELGDDFEAYGLLTRLYVYGYNPSFFQYQTPTGVNVRFYQWGNPTPGALISQQFVPATAPGFALGQDGGLDMKLVTPFAANGKYFMSLQMVFTNGQGWYWQYDCCSATYGSQTIWGNPAKVKSHFNGFQWANPLWVGTNVAIQLRFVVFGEDGTPPDLGSDPCGVWKTRLTPDVANSSHSILRDVATVSSNEAWAVGHQTILSLGNYLTVPLVQHWDGVAWTVVPTPIPEPYANGANCGFYSVAVVGPNEVWAAGWQNKQDAAGYIGTHMMVQRWNGSQWTLIDTPMPGTLQLQSASGDLIRGIEVISPNDIWFVGDWVSISGPSQPALALHWDGSNFTIHSTPYFSNGGHGLEDVSATGPNDVWAVGGAGDGDWGINSYVIHFDGSNWSQIYLPTPGIIQRLFAVEAIAPNDVWACGQTQIGNEIFPWFVHWNGTQFSEVPSPGGTLGLHAFSSNDVYSAGGGVFHWDGAAWTSIAGDLDDSVGVSFGGIHGTSQCALIAVGREIVGSDLKTYAAHVVPSTWVNLSGGVAGPQGATLGLFGKGTLEDGDPVVLKATAGKPLTPGTLFLGVSPLGAPLFGGTFWPMPQLAISGLTTDGAGAFTLFADWPSGVPSGTVLYMQYWQPDPAAPFGVRGSNGLGAVAP